MRLSDIMSAAGLEVYAEIALGLFVLAFALVALMLVAGRNQSVWERARWLPLSEAPVRGSGQKNDPSQQEAA